MIKNVNFMSHTYNVIGEPLNLLENGQKWFTTHYNKLIKKNNKKKETALILGATPWLGKLCLNNHKRVYFTDMSKKMLRKSMNIIDKQTEAVQFIQSDWLTLPRLDSPLDTVCADNSFAFLHFPQDWQKLLSYLAESMLKGNVLISRFFECPKKYHKDTVSKIIKDCINQKNINFTEVRARLMFAHLDEKTYGINMDQVVQTFEDNFIEFEALMKKYPNYEGNDLVTIRKYKDTGLILYSPSIADIVGLVSKWFNIKEISYGPYALSEYFPLLVAQRK